MLALNLSPGLLVSVATVSIMTIVRVVPDGTMISSAGAIGFGAGAALFGGALFAGALSAGVLSGAFVEALLLEAESGFAGVAGAAAALFCGEAADEFAACSDD